MPDWLKILGLTIISPTRGLNEAYIRSPFIASFVLLFFTYALFLFFSHGSLLLRYVEKKAFLIVFVLVIAFISTLVTNLIFVPILIAISNFFTRRGSIGQVIQQEFVSTASTVGFAYTVVNLLSFILVFIGTKGSWGNVIAAQSAKAIQESQKMVPNFWNRYDAKDIDIILTSKETLVASFLQMFILPLTFIFVALAVHIAFRTSWFRTIVISIVGLVSTNILGALFQSTLVGFILGSPILLLLGFFLLQGYFREIARRRQAQVDFKQSLETATLNPSDASAHYNLGLLYQKQNDFDEAKKSFEKAAEIDDDEIDAHYQLGKIARAQNSLQEAINHFTEVISRSQNHAQYEIWREVGATYIAANQYADAKDALDNFLAERPADPEGLYLMGRAQAGMGDKRAAIAMMQACIQAVKTAPTYKYRLEQRWLNEAEKFLKTNA